MSDMGWSKYVADVEDNAMEACITTAIRNGHTKEEAEDCDDGSVGCPDCPFNPQLEKGGSNEGKGMG